MGLGETASPTEMRKQYQRLISALMSAENGSTPDQVRRYQTARERLSVAYESAKRQLMRGDQLHGSVTGSGLLLGEILVDADVITPEQLSDALVEQAKLKPPLPLGRILVGRKLISWDQLAYYLRLQDLLQLSTTHQTRLSRQLIELGLASRAEMDVAELDCDTTGCSLVHAVIRRGWIRPVILAILTNSPDKLPDKVTGQTRAPATSGKAFVISV